jgi:hypothetical protein
LSVKSCGFDETHLQAKLTQIPHIAILITFSRYKVEEESQKVIDGFDETHLQAKLTQIPHIAILITFSRYKVEEESQKVIDVFILYKLNNKMITFLGILLTGSYPADFSRQRQTSICAEEDDRLQTADFP